MKTNAFFRLIALNLALLMTVMMPFSAFAAATVSVGSNTITVDSDEKAALTFTTEDGEKETAYCFSLSTNASLVLYDGETEVSSMKNGSSYYYELLPNHQYNLQYDGSECSFADKVYIETVKAMTVGTPTPSYGTYAFIPEKSGVYHFTKYVSNIFSVDLIASSNGFYNLEGNTLYVVNTSAGCSVEEVVLDFSHAATIQDGENPISFDENDTAYYQWTADDITDVVEYQITVTGANMVVFNEDANKVIVPDSAGYDSSDRVYTYSFNAGTTYHFYMRKYGSAPGGASVKIKINIETLPQNGWKYFDTVANEPTVFFLSTSRSAWYRFSSLNDGESVEIYQNNALVDGIWIKQWGSNYFYVALDAHKTYTVKHTSTTSKTNENIYVAALAEYTENTTLNNETFYFIPEKTGFYSGCLEVFGKDGLLTPVGGFDSGIHYFEKDQPYFFQSSGTPSLSLLEGFSYEESLFEEGVYWISGYYGLDPVITIPTWIDGHPITGIASNAFQSHPFLSSVTIPEKITHIYNSAFEDCKMLNEIHLHNNLQMDRPFDGTAYYNNPANWKDNLLYIGNYVVSSNSEKTPAHVQLESGTILASNALTWSKFNSLYIEKDVIDQGNGMVYPWISVQHIAYEGAKEDWDQNGFYYEFSNWANEPKTIIHYEVQPNDLIICGRDIHCAHCEKVIATLDDQTEEQHSSIEWIVDSNATCNTPGVGHKICTVCGVEVEGNITIPATGNHTPGEWATTKEPTAAEEGQETQTCSVCGAVVNTRPIEKLPPAPIFTDVATDAYYSAPVQWAVEKGITTGTSASTFSPANTCSRAQIVTFLWRAAGCPEPASDAMPFTDVPANAYYYKAVQWAVEKNITTGTSATTFSPGKNCSRGQIVTFLWRAEGAEKTEGANPFGDVAENAYYADAVLWAVEKNITTGTSATSFSAGNACTRGQIVTFLYRCYQ